MCPRGAWLSFDIWILQLLTIQGDDLGGITEQSCPVWERRRTTKCLANLLEKPAATPRGIVAITAAIGGSMNAGEWEWERVFGTDFLWRRYATWARWWSAMSNCLRRRWLSSSPEKGHKHRQQVHNAVSMSIWNLNASVSPGYYMNILGYSLSITLVINRDGNAFLKPSRDPKPTLST